MITLPRAVADYLTEFHLAAVYISFAGKIGVATPSHLSRREAVAAWWCASRSEAEAVLTAIGERHPANAEDAIKAAAARLGVVLADHSTVVQRAGPPARAAPAPSLVPARRSAQCHGGSR